MEKLREVVDASSCAAVGRKIGYSRVAISHIYHGRYGANTDRIKAAFLEANGDGPDCPHLGQAISPAECADYRSGPMPTSDPTRFKRWTACQACPLNPDRKRTSNA
ncbi:hypothetical protein RA27_20400 [Ruegeria sp. ANG-R]|nr:hypothetical protein RA27_20400 [Ruegeria sp. ANG-R]